MTKLAFTALAALALTTTPALAQTITTTVEIPVTDLDLSTAEGQAALESRVDAAAKAVCGDARTRDLKAMATWDECRARAQAEALAQLAFASPFDGMELASRF